CRSEDRQLRGRRAARRRALLRRCARAGERREDNHEDLDSTHRNLLRLTLSNEPSAQTECRSEYRSLVFGDHHLGGLDHGGDGVPLLETHFLDAARRDDRFDEVLSDLDRDVRADIADDDLRDLAFEPIACAERHTTSLQSAERKIALAKINT